MFEKTFVINLPLKRERLALFMNSVPQCLGAVTVWNAVHGDIVQHPAWWTAGKGAWGCYRSHLGILEHCYNTGVESYVVFEDDAIFRPEFDTSLGVFKECLPEDWEQVYLGGQLLDESNHPPKRVNEGCYIPYNVNRTHGFAVHRRGYEKLYRHLHTTPFNSGHHIDHHLGRLHESGGLRVYVPSKWLVGQDGGPSSISDNVNAANFWVDPENVVKPRPDETEIPAVFLEAPLEVALELSRRGWHRGYWVDHQHLDRGVCDAMASNDFRQGLKRWYDCVRSEGIRDNAQCVCLYHPKLTLEQIQSLKFARFLHIRTSTADEAEADYRELTNRKTPLTTDPKGKRIEAPIQVPLF